MQIKHEETRHHLSVINPILNCYAYVLSHRPDRMTKFFIALVLVSLCPFGVEAETEGCTINQETVVALAKWLNGDAGADQIQLVCGGVAGAGAVGGAVGAVAGGKTGASIGGWLGSFVGLNATGQALGGLVGGALGEPKACSK